MRTATRGSGLGLAIVRLIVEAHHGRLQAAAPPFGGLALRIELPRAPQAPGSVRQGGDASGQESLPIDLFGDTAAIEIGRDPAIVQRPAAPSSTHRSMSDGRCDDPVGQHPADLVGQGGRGALDAPASELLGCSPTTRCATTSGSRRGCPSVHR